MMRLESVGRSSPRTRKIFAVRCLDANTHAAWAAEATTCWKTGQARNSPETNSATARLSTENRH